MNARWSTELHQRWQRLAARERRAVAWAAAVLGLAVLWSAAIAPAWRTVRQAPLQRAQQEATLQTLRAQAAEAQDLRGRAASSRHTRADALRTLEASTSRWLGPTARTVAGDDRITVTLQAASPEALAHWLNDIRLNTGLYPTQAHLERADDADVHWKGTLLLGGAALEQP